jgi:GNAT superfamily N-acetyltransferase
MTDAAGSDEELPSEDEVVDRLTRHLRSWLGAWPPTGEVTVASSPRRLEPGWDGRVRPFAGVSTPAGTVLSVTPDRVDAVRAAGSTLDDVLDALPTVLGQPGGVVGRGVYRYSVSPPHGVPVGEWVAADEPGVPPWLRPFGGNVLMVREGGEYVAGLGIKRHDDLGRELAVATEEAWRGRGLARGLVVRAARAILGDGGVPIYLHGRGNAASARVAEAAGFPDLGWFVLGLPTAS